jgi:hypothetical protein
VNVTLDEVPRLTSSRRISSLFRTDGQLLTVSEGAEGRRDQESVDRDTALGAPSEDRRGLVVASESVKCPGRGVKIRLRRATEQSASAQGSVE